MAGPPLATVSDLPRSLSQQPFAEHRARRFSRKRRLLFARFGPAVGFARCLRLSGRLQLAICADKKTRQAGGGEGRGRRAAIEGGRQTSCSVIADVVAARRSAHVLRGSLAGSSTASAACAPLEKSHSGAAGARVAVAARAAQSRITRIPADQSHAERARTLGADSAFGHQLLKRYERSDSLREGRQAG